MQFSRGTPVFTYCNTEVPRFTIWETRHCGLFTRAFISINFLPAEITKIKSRATNNLSSKKLRVLQSFGDIQGNMIKSFLMTHAVKVSETVC